MIICGELVTNKSLFKSNSVSSFYFDVQITEMFSDSLSDN